MLYLLPLMVPRGVAGTRNLSFRNLVTGQSVTCKGGDVEISLNRFSEFTEFKFQKFCLFLWGWCHAPEPLAHARAPFSQSKHREICEQLVAVTQRPQEPGARTYLEAYVAEKHGRGSIPQRLYPNFN